MPDPSALPAPPSQNTPRTSIDLHQPAGLEPVSIAKPWGRELWFTGVEARGESLVQTSSGQIPLSQYLAMGRERVCNGRELLLLKILEQNPAPVLGNLYLEAHRSKHEVYVVTHVDESAWPDGIGAVRLGANQRLRHQFADDEAFRRAFLSAVRDYEAIRRAADKGTHVPPQAEIAKREAMEAFTELVSVRPGDVVNVPPWQPHSLQHGVRVVELQTPTFERLIISFAQRVLTQEHWDSDEAIMGLDLAPAAPPDVVPVAQGIEQIGRFDDIAAWRVSIGPHRSMNLDFLPHYAACICLSGSVTANGLTRHVEQACLIPHAALPLTLTNPTAEPTVCLVAGPAATTAPA